MIPKERRARIALETKQRAERAVAFDSVEHDGEDIFKAIRIAGWWVEKSGLRVDDAEGVHLARHIALALKAEREAVFESCAKLAEEHAPQGYSLSTYGIHGAGMAIKIAAAIRARAKEST